MVRRAGEMIEKRLGGGGVDDRDVKWGTDDGKRGSELWSRRDER